MSLLQSLLDASSHAVLTLDRQGIITHINQRAKQRFGLFNRSPHPHGAGRLEVGDVVILADTAIGAGNWIRPGSASSFSRIRTLLSRTRSIAVTSM